MNTPTTQVFKKAVPIWPKGQRSEWNRMVGFYATVQLAESSPDAFLKITGADSFRIWVNHEHAGYGPARGPHGYSRVDEWPLTEFLKEGINHLAIEVLTNGIDSYASVLQAPFLQAELIMGGEVLVSTREDFEAYLLPERIQKVERFSKQRPFAEAYRLSERSYDWRIGKGDKSAIECENVEQVSLLPRHVPLQKFDCIEPERLLATGGIQRAEPPRPQVKKVARDGVGKRVRGYPVEELEIDLSLELNELAFKEEASSTGCDHVTIGTGQTALYAFEKVEGGFLGIRFRCEEKTRLYLMFDEVRDRNLFVLGVGAMALDVEPGDYSFESIDPYTFKFLRVLSLQGSVIVEKVYVREYTHPAEKLKELDLVDEELKVIADACHQTFRTNSIDLFTDCMSRERGGYPCDSWFTGRTEKVLTGENRVERNFLENYFLVEKFSSIPEGMFPHCYPSDRLGQGQYIPNWALWLVLQMCRYCRENQDAALRDLAYPRVVGLFKWFEPCLNEIGLLEDIPGWIFVEWSPANDSTDAVNHPTNMLYAACLSAAGHLYEREDWTSQAETVKRAVIQESWDGSFFHDQSIRVDGALTRTDVRTETCQYHAFAFGLAESDSFGQLWAKLRDRWGPMRGMHMAMSSGNQGWRLYYDEGCGPQADDSDLAPAGLLYGLMLRFDLLQEKGEWNRLEEEVKKVFGPMAKESGTLWEHVEDHASLNHGFASCALEYIHNMTRIRE